MTARRRVTKRGQAWPEEVVSRAKQLRSELGYGELRISKILYKELDRAPSANVVREWIRGRARQDVQ